MAVAAMRPDYARQSDKRYRTVRRETTLLYLDDREEGDLLEGTLPPARRASDNPIAIACFGLFTVLSEFPDLSSPRFISCIARSTFSEALFPYFTAMIRSLVLFSAT